MCFAASKWSSTPVRSAACSWASSPKTSPAAWIPIRSVSPSACAPASRHSIFPAMIPLWMFPMAIVCGNTFVLKPSEQDPMTPMLLAELAQQAGVPPGVLNVIHGGKRAVDALCSHPDIAAVSFVGSTHVGTHVYNLATQHGKRVQCMMGAKNHAVVMPDANKEQSLNAVVGVDVRRRRTALHGHLGHRPGGRSPQVDTGHRCQGKDAQSQCRQRKRHRCGPGGVAECEAAHLGLDRGRRQGGRHSSISMAATSRSPATRRAISSAPRSFRASRRT